MSVFALPAILALTAKLIVMFLYRRSLQQNTHFTLLVLIFAAHNLCEVLVFWEFFNGMKAEFLLRSYYVVSLTSLVFVAQYVARVGEQTNVLLNRLMLLGLALFAVFFIFSQTLVAGVEPWGHVFTAVRGDFYPVFQLAALLLAAYIGVVLFQGYKSASSHLTQIRCAYSALAFAPLMLAIFLIICLMNMGLQINGAVIFPIATTLFLMIMLISEDRHRMTDIRRFIPFSDERQTSNQIMEIFSNYARDEANYRDSINQIEKLLVQHKYEKNDRNATYAAERMGMPRSSLYSLFNRLGIEKDGGS